MQPIVKIKNVNLTYNEGKASEFKALRNINLEIYPEEFVIFFGPSGSGKSTLLYLIAGLEMASSGTVTVGQYRDLKALSNQEMVSFHRSFIGMIFQAFYLVPSLTAKDNVELPMVFAGVEPLKRSQIAQTLLDRFGITEFKDRVPARLSGGQQQRVAIARSLVNNPSIVLADEPVGNLDSKNAEIVLDLIADLKNKDKKTVILVTHDPSHLHKADRVFYIKDGSIVKVANQKEDKHHGYEAFKQAEKSPESDTETILSKFAKVYPNLTKEQLLSKLLVHDALVPYNIDILIKTEEIITRFIQKEIKTDELYTLLDESTAGGGVSLYEPTAHRLITSVLKVTQEVKITGSTKNAQKIFEYLLEENPVILSNTQKKLFLVAVANVVSKKSSSTEFFTQLDRSLEDGGVGLNTRTAQHFQKKVELLLAGAV